MNNGNPFLKMIMAKDKSTELTIINTAIENESDNENTNSLDMYYDNVLESIDDVDADTFADLKDYEEKQAIKRLLKLYKLGGTLSNYLSFKNKWDFPGGPVVKNLPANAGDTGLIPGQGRRRVPRSSEAPRCRSCSAWALEPSNRKH